MKLVHIGGRELLIAQNSDEASLFAAIRFIHVGRQAILNHQFFSVALSGGQTPRKLYEILAQPAMAERLDWSKVRLFWSDERAVPPDHPESNFHVAMEYFSKPPLNQATLFRMHAEEADLHRAAHRYETQISANCWNNRLDLLLLGMGSDGHTASLFPDSEVLSENERLVAPSIDDTTGMRRLTLTIPCIQDALFTLVLVFGKEKAEVLKEVCVGIKEPKKCPAKYIGKGRLPALFIVTPDATSLLPPEACL